MLWRIRQRDSKHVDSIPLHINRQCKMESRVRGGGTTRGLRRSVLCSAERQTFPKHLESFHQAFWGVSMTHLPQDRELRLGEGRRLEPSLFLKTRSANNEELCVCKMVGLMLSQLRHRAEIGWKLRVEGKLLAGESTTCKAYTCSLSEACKVSDFGRRFPALLRQKRGCPQSPPSVLSVTGPEHPRPLPLPPRM